MDNGKNKNVCVCSRSNKLRPKAFKQSCTYNRISNSLLKLKSSTKKIEQERLIVILFTYLDSYKFVCLINIASGERYY